MTLMVGGYAILKGGMFAHRTAQAIEIRNNEILSAQRKKEIEERSAVVAAVRAEAAAKVGGSSAGVRGNVATALTQNGTVNAAAAQATARLARANLARAQSELLTAKNVANSTLMTKLDTAAKVKAGQASLYNCSTQAQWMAYIQASNRHELARIRMKNASKVAIDAETASIAAQTAALKANAAASAFSPKNTIINVAKTGVGFSGGFKAMFDTVSFVSDLKTSGLALKQFGGLLKGNFAPLHGMNTGLGELKIALTGAGAAVGKLAATITSIFSAANIIIAGSVAAVVGAVDMAQSLIRGKGFVDGTFLLKPIGEWIVGIETLQERANDLDTSIATVLELRRAKQSIDRFAEDVTESFANLWKQDIELSDMKVADQMEHFWGEFSLGLVKHQKKYNAETLRAAEQNAQVARARYELFEASVAKVFASGHDIDERSKADRKRYREAYESAEKNLQDLQTGSQESGTRLRNWAKSIRDLAASQVEALSGINSMIDAQRFSMMNPEQQNAATLAKIAAERDNYYRACQEEDFAVASKAFKSMLDAHNTVVKEAEKRINSMNKLNDTLKTDAFDYQLKSAKSVQEKIALLRIQAQQLYRESNGRWSRGRFLVPQGNADLTESYGKAKQAIELEIQAMQEEISRKQQLAEAERNANAQTVKLIQSMDKFKATTTTAVNANSLQAQELQSRRFNQLPSYTPATQAQTSLTNSQNQLRELYRQAQELIRQYQQAAQQRQAQEEARRDKLVQDLNNIMDKNVDALSKWEKAMEDLPKKITEAAKEAFSASEKTERHLNDIRNTIRNL